MKYHVKLTRVVNGSALRTDEVEGFTNALPAHGKCFQMAGESLTPGGIARVVTTSPVVSTEGLDHDVLLVKTQNSTYRLDILE